MGNNMQQRRQQLHGRGLDQQILQRLVQQLPLHPRQWNMAAATCSELRDALDEGRKILQRAICSEHNDMRMLRAARRRFGGLLTTLANHGETAEAIRVVVAGASVDCRGKWKETALIWAAARDDVGLADVLIGVGAQLDLQTDSGYNALMWASCGGRTEIAVALINARAQLDLQNDAGATALMWASYGGRTEIVLALIDAGAQLGLQDIEGSTASDLASAQGHPEIVQALKTRRSSQRALSIVASAL